jgi:hypothetical protein
MKMMSREKQVFERLEKMVLIRRVHVAMVKPIRVDPKKYVVRNALG